MFGVSENCCRCRVRKIRTIETEDTSGPAEDSLCIGCSLYAGKHKLREFAETLLKIGTAQGLSDMIRIFVATMFPTQEELARAIGGRCYTAEHHAKLAAEHLIALAEFIHGDGWVPPTPKPKNKPWVMNSG